MDGVLEQVKVCEGVLAEEKQQHANTKQELARLGQELEMAREDLVRERTKHREDVEVLFDTIVMVCLGRTTLKLVTCTSHVLPTIPCVQSLLPFTLTKQVILSFLHYVELLSIPQY